MVTDKKVIEEVAKRYCKETDCTQEEASLIEEGFKEGAYWGIKEFLKGLWHDASEEPEKNKYIIEKIHDSSVIVYEIGVHRPVISWREHVKRFDTLSWAYLDDILSKEGGEK